MKKIIIQNSYQSEDEKKVFFYFTDSVTQNTGYFRYNYENATAVEILPSAAGDNELYQLRLDYNKNLYLQPGDVEEIGDNDISDKINAHKNYIIAFSKIGRYEDNVLSVQEKLMSDGEFSIRDLAILTRTTYAEDGVLTASELTSQDLDKETMELGRMLGEINKCSEAGLKEIRNSAGNYSVNIKNGTITFDR